MCYDAMDVAKYIITRCTNMGKPISNLKLQKMLYFLWIGFFEITGEILFNNDICAWQLGPVVPDVYYEYCSYAGLPINAKYLNTIERSDKKILDDLIEKYIDISAFQMVNLTHVSGGAWDTIYRDGIGNRSVIPFQLIIDKGI